MLSLGRRAQQVLAVVAAVAVVAGIVLAVVGPTEPGEDYWMPGLAMALGAVVLGTPAWSPIQRRWTVSRWEDRLEGHVRGLDGLEDRGTGFPVEGTWRSREVRFRVLHQYRNSVRLRLTMPMPRDDVVVEASRGGEWGVESPEDLARASGLGPGALEEVEPPAGSEALGVHASDPELARAILGDVPTSWREADRTPREVFDPRAETVPFDGLAVAGGEARYEWEILAEEDLQEDDMQAALAFLDDVATRLE